jgi:hypothetical protein
MVVDHQSLSIIEDWRNEPKMAEKKSQVHLGSFCQTLLPNRSSHDGQDSGKWLGYVLILADLSDVLGLYFLPDHYD